MKVVHTQIHASPFFADLLSESDVPCIIDQGILSISPRHYAKHVRIYKSQILAGRKSLATYIDKLKSIYTARPKVNVADRYAQARAAGAYYVHICLLQAAAREALLESLRAPPERLLEVYVSLTHPHELTAREQARAMLLQIALHIERNKTLKKSFTSSPEKIMEKLRTFYINIYNQILLYVKNYGWVKSTPASYCLFDDTEVLRDLKNFLKEANIKREHAVLHESLPKVKQQIRSILRREKLTKKAQQSAAFARQISYLDAIKEDFFLQMMYSMHGELCSIARQQRIDEDALLQYTWKEWQDMQAGKRVAKRTARSVQYHIPQGRIVSSKGGLLATTLKTIPCVCNFTHKISGVLGKDIVVSNQLVQHQAKVLCIYGRPDIFSLLFSHVQQQALAIEVGALALLPKGTKVVVHGAKHEIRIA